MDPITYKQHIIDRWYVVRRIEDRKIIGEYPTAKEAMKNCPSYCDIEAACAERIDKDGNLNPAVYAPYMTAAVRKLKSIL